MASTLDFVEYVLEQIEGVGNIRHRKMFGEFMVYINDKPILLICDNTVYVKKLDILDKRLTDTGFPYKGAKEHYLLDIEDKELTKFVVNELEKVTAVPKTKKKKE